MKYKDISKLGLVSQEKLNLAASHVNSAPRKKLGGKSRIKHHVSEQVSEHDG